ncbi:MAG: anaerobic ribonucleoside-triphosphate reductase activating protein [Candidatus Caldatribacterium sp.]|uniref:anaerobic ribonucleoside-triphosphate reductase activating protein n=1 Tax=Candidatus Caldatribacterium sp. TaxID=2282143 RepID=UPI00299950BC|nr:anaerobic ribonucleoside-triphosphate reductase activating protein [Candidatus Caldatribacterium sp.]MCX7731049.1 anaerobic ribonucleoside-triphosphate reductase activating protein [Candidatus Caldatribacterium sp.]MDW8081220.1 anaerobic ribonucleoside-triphosphate reductase activating protein [Candidatus Calescibacterium sp.]
MTFQGWQRVSFIEYPGKIATVLFVAGCNFRCPFCHNPELVLQWENLPSIEEDEVLAYLKHRQGLLDAVCITGGEPLIYARKWFPFLEKVKELGYLVKVDTNGSFFKEFLALWDYVDLWGIDFKVPLGKYHLVRGETWEESVRKVLEKALANPDRVEIRTTIYPPFHTPETLLAMAQTVQDARVWYWQNFHREKNLAEEAQSVTPYSFSFLRTLQDMINAEVGRELVVLRL